MIWLNDSGIYRNINAAPVQRLLAVKSQDPNMDFINKVADEAMKKEIWHNRTT